MDMFFFFFFWKGFNPANLLMDMFHGKYINIYGIILLTLFSNSSLQRLTSLNIKSSLISTIIRNPSHSDQNCKTFLSHFRRKYQNSEFFSLIPEKLLRFNVHHQHYNWKCEPASLVRKITITTYFFCMSCQMRVPN